MSNTQNSIGTTSVDLDIKMRSVRLGMLYAQLPQGLLATLINASALVFIQTRVVETWIALTWLAVVAAIAIARGVLFILYKRSKPASNRIGRWEKFFLVGVLAAAATWGSTAFLLFPDDSYIHQAFTGFVLAGMAAGAVSSFAASHRMFLAFMLPTCLPYALQLFLHGSEMQIAMGMMTLAFIATTSISSKKSHAATTEALRLRYENLDLVEQLAQSTQKLSKANAGLRGKIAERRKVQKALSKSMEEARAATQAKSQFLANMSHEIRTPMNGVIGMADILSRSQLNRRQHRQVSLIQSSAKTLLSLLNDILDVSRIEAGRVELECTSFGIREVIGDAVDVLAEQAQSKGLELAYEIDHEVWHSVRGDPTRLRQVLINLVGNAVKFTEKGSVVLRVSNVQLEPLETAHIHFSVTDSGIGIDPALQSSLFQPFKQGDPSVTRRLGGSGLGLSISHHLVNLMGGTLECTSTHGQGSKFFFTLPFGMGDQDASEGLRPDQLLSTCRVLLADESDVSRGIIANYFKAWQINITTVSDGASVGLELKRAAQGGSAYTALLASTSLGDMDALDLAADIYADQTIGGTKIVLLTPLDWSINLKTPQHANIVRCLAKPVRQSQLLEAIVGITRSNLDEGCYSAAAAAGTESRLTNVVPQYSGRVLVVEDNPVNQEVARDYLQEFGCKTTVVDNGLAALSECQCDDYDMVFMDYQMPHMDGIQATRRIRSNETKHGRKRLPIIALTAGAFSGEKEQCLAAGMDDYVSKPFSQDDIEATLQKWLPSDRHCMATDAMRDRVVEETSVSTATSIAELHTAPLDQRHILKLRARVSGLLPRLANIYLDHASKQLKVLQQAEVGVDFVAIKLAAHSLKSSSANIGAIHLSEMCGQLETNAEMKNTTAARNTLKSVHAEFERVKLALLEETSRGNQLDTNRVAGKVA